MTKEEEKSFLASGILEVYLLGNTSAEETDWVEKAIASSSVIAKEFELLQEDLEQIVKANAMKAPVGVKTQAKEKIAELASKKESKIIQYNWWKDYRSIAAILIGVIGISYAVLLQNETGQLKAEKQNLNSRLAELEQKQYADVTRMGEMDELQKEFLDPNNQKVSLSAATPIGPLQVAALWNEKEGSAKLLASKLPELPKERCFQIWADVDGEMLSVAILSEGEFVDVNYYEGATSLNITIEPAGGSEHATVATLQASGIIS